MKFSLLFVAVCLFCFCSSSFAVLERVQKVINDINTKIDSLNTAVAARSGYEIREQFGALVDSYKNGYDVIDGLKDGGISVQAANDICTSLESKQVVFETIEQSLINQRDIYSSPRSSYRADYLRIAKQLSAQITVFYDTLAVKVTAKGDGDVKARVIYVRDTYKKDTKDIIVGYCISDKECAGYRDD